MEYKNQLINSQVSILVADDHPITFISIETILLDHKEYIMLPPIKSGNNLNEYLKSHPVDLLILDIDLPVLNGLDFLKLYRKNYPDLKIILFTMHEGAGYFLHAMEYNINGYILKTDDLYELPSILSNILKGNFYCTKKFISYLEGKRTDILTERELNIIELVAEGFKYQEIAEKFDISRSTVDYHLVKLRNKFDAENNMELVNIIKQKYFK